MKPENLRSKLKGLLNEKQLIRAIEVHNGISALVANNTRVECPGDATTKHVASKFLEFDALWVSSLTSSASKGFPDIETMSLDLSLDTIELITNVTSKPVIVDGDTGRDLYSFQYFLTRLEKLGVSAIVIEDKTFPKRNSLDPDAIQNLENPDVFSNKIRTGKSALLSEDFLIFARLESLIAGCGVDDALFRAKKYLHAGVDGILIHSRERNPVNLLKFAEEYENLCKELSVRKPLVCIPTTYDTITEDKLKDYGFNIVIYANHLLRASIRSMEEVAKLILLNGRAFETEPYCAPVGKIFDMVGFTEITQRDIRSLVERSRARVIIPAAGEPKENIIDGMPTAMLCINGRSILQRQLDILRRCEINDVIVVRGYEKEKFNTSHVKYYDVEDHKKGSLASLFTARDELRNGFILIFSDIIFDESIINNLLRSREDITIIADASYPFHRHEIDKELDLVIGKQRDAHYRQPFSALEKEVSFIGKKIRKDIATHEFIGIARFAEQGAQNLVRVYEDCIQKHKGRFHESESIEKGSIVDLLQEMIDRGFKVHYTETNKGWMEIHNRRDYEIALKMLD